MGTKYSTVSVTSYNASPPADDGTQDASNQLNWDKHKTKIGDPLKTAIESINTNLVTALNQSVVAKTDSYNITAAEHNKSVVVTTTSAGVNISLPDAATAAAGFITTVINAADSTDALTIDLVTDSDFLNSTSNGTITLPVDSSLTFIVNSGANGYNIKDEHGFTRPITSTKTSDGTALDTTLVSDDELRWTLAANQKYYISGKLWFTQSGSNFTTTGMKWKFTGLSGTPTAAGMIAITYKDGANTTETALEQYTAYDTEKNFTPGGGNLLVFDVHITITDSGDGGVLIFQYAENTTAGGSIVLELGSTLTVQLAD